MITMKTLIALALSLTILCGVSFADDSTPVPETGFGPSVVGSVGKFFFNGNYSLADAGVFFGSAYTFTDKKNNVNSVGIYAGPSSQFSNGVTTTSIDVMAYLNLYQTQVGGFGVGIGTQFWQSGKGVAMRSDTSYIALGYKF